MSSVSETTTEYIEMEALKPNFRDLKLIVKIVDMGVQRVVNTRRTRRDHRVTEAHVGDKTGSALLTLWDDQIDRFSIGDVLEIKNAYTTLYRGSLRLNVARNGGVEKVEKDIEEVNTKNNLSEVRHETTRWYDPVGRPFRRRRRR